MSKEFQRMIPSPLRYFDRILTSLNYLFRSHIKYFQRLEHVKIDDFRKFVWNETHADILWSTRNGPSSRMKKLLLTS